MLCLGRRISVKEESYNGSTQYSDDEIDDEIQSFRVSNIDLIGVGAKKAEIDCEALNSGIFEHVV